MEELRLFTYGMEERRTWWNGNGINWRRIKNLLQIVHIWNGRTWEWKWNKLEEDQEFTMDGGMDWRMK